MSNLRYAARYFIPALVALVLLVCAPAGTVARDKGGDSAKAPASVRLTVVVTGDDNKPVDSASVYLRFNKAEMNLKTNLSGVCHAPEIPQGRILIQVVAPGWKPFGEYYDANQAEQTINIALVRPPKWY